MPVLDITHLFTAQPIIRWTLDPMDKIKCPLDISMTIGSNRQLKCPLDICLSKGSIGSNWPLDILPLPSLRPACGRCQPMTSFELTYLPHNQISTGHILSIGSNGQNQMSTGHIYDHWIQWTAEMSIGHTPVQWIHWIQWTIGHTAFAILQACLHAWGRCPYCVVGFPFIFQVSTPPCQVPVAKPREICTKCFEGLVNNILLGDKMAHFLYFV
jgi:hypothetical protein